MSRRFAVARVLGVLLGLAAVAADKFATPPLPIEYGDGRELGQLANREIGESSGVAASRTRPGVFWTHNDSGGQPKVFALGMKGEDLGDYMVQGATATDWEDIASFSLGKKKSYLLIADVGDNNARRSFCTLYLVREPGANAKLAKAGSLPVDMRVDFTYEDGPRNCESVAVDPVRGEIILVSKTADPTCKAYVLQLPRSSHVKNAVAKSIGTLSIPTTTAMDISPDGLRAMVLTYGDAFEYTRGAGEDWKAAFARQPRTIRMPARAQGESLCYGLDGQKLYLTSEKIPCPLLEVAPVSGKPAGGGK